ncbi:FAD-dependent oxidoreductase [Saccharopolyspora sp. TS4A08]|uniref:FAD-dependent oxidoreductase n=1 Tax=Saccharopolyspora ipomoeae TaxID=3042027 RepID=A0ABT6PQU4_9PSEU|nr:FAD-dependent oxidoreductase [Saccharopolyspora sp. TS4A08]MDI2030210.1 FAD-dependent oxidoreductase [Saccharopolyspora sp. TS4A08]
MSAGVVIVGAGQAGAQLAMSLREMGHAGSVTVIGDEHHPPYHRPPLSKDFLDGGLAESELALRTEEYYRDRGIELVAGTAVTSIDRGRNEVLLSSGRVVAYAHLVLATGARNRQLPIADGGADNVHYLRTMEDARRVRHALERAQNVLIVGAGFIGLEFASAAARRGARVTVVEAAPRVLGRAVAEETSAYFAHRHAVEGSTVLCGCAVDEFRTDSRGRVTEVRIGDRVQPVDLVLVGIGVAPNSELAEEAGLVVNDGIVVDAQLVTSDPAISAIGDCARFPRAGAASIRLESVQNASDQARYAARRICRADEPIADYGEVPWFWSHQAGDKLQIAGLALPTDSAVFLGDPSSGRFSVCRFRDGFLSAVESVNSPGDHLSARKLFARGARVTEEQLRAPEFSLRSAAAGGTTQAQQERTSA